MSEIRRLIKAAKLRQAVERLGKEKKAGLWKSFTNKLAKSDLGSEIGSAMIGAAAGATVTAAGAGAMRGIQAATDGVFKARHYKNMLGNSPGLRKQRDAKKTQATFNTLWNLNRQLAKDPLAAGSFVERSMNQAEFTDSAGVYVDPQTATMLQKGAPRESNRVMDAWAFGASRGSGKKKERTLERKSFSEEADLSRYREQLRRARRPDELENPFQRRRKR